MDKFIKKFYIVLSMAMVYIVFIVLLESGVFGNSNEDYACKRQKNFTETRFSGVIKKKFIDSNNHLLKTLILRERDVKFSIYYFNDDNTNTFSLVSVGDTLLKEAGSDNISIKGAKIDTIVQVDYGCNN